MFKSEMSLHVVRSHYKNSRHSLTLDKCWRFWIGICSKYRPIELCENFNVAYGSTVMEHSVELRAIICAYLSQRMFVTRCSQCYRKAVIVHCGSVSESYSSRRRPGASVCYGIQIPGVVGCFNSDRKFMRVLSVSDLSRINSGNI
jgi:hypothetical protein